MKARFGSKMFVYFISISFLLMTTGFPFIANAKERIAPLGEMMSQGDVKFEAKANVWKDVEPSYFPIFQGTKIKTGKGTAVLTLPNNSQIKVSSKSLFSFDQDERFNLMQGSIEFRMPAKSETAIKVGKLWVTNSRSPQTIKNPSAASTKDEEVIGSISIHSNGSVTIKSTQGILSILNQDNVIQTALAAKDSITLPSVVVKGLDEVMVSQAPADDPPAWGLLIGGALFGGTVGGVVGTSHNRSGGGPACP